MIRTTVKQNTRALDELDAFMDDFARLASDIGERAFNRIQEPLLDELRYYPAPRPNQKYVRTFRLRDGWTVDYKRASGGFEIVVGNRTPYTKFVVGSLAQARAAAASFQAWMHKGRWPLAVETVNFWLEAFSEEFRAEFNQELAAFGSASSSRRGFTR
jgi:hypothetical protein